MEELNKWIGWFRKRVTIKDYEEDYLKFAMAEYARIYHERQINKSSHNNTIESFCECGLPMTTFRGEPVCSGILSTCSKNK